MNLDGLDVECLFLTTVILLNANKKQVLFAPGKDL